MYYIAIIKGEISLGINKTPIPFFKRRRFKSKAESLSFAQITESFNKLTIKIPFLNKNGRFIRYKTTVEKISKKALRVEFKIVKRKEKKDLPLFK